MAVQGGALSGPGELEARMRELGMIPPSREERKAQLQEAFAPAWRVVTSQKPRREGEAFLVCHGEFALKVYRGFNGDAVAFAHRLAKLLNETELHLPSPDIPEETGQRR